MKFDEQIAYLKSDRVLGAELLLQANAALAPLNVSLGITSPRVIVIEHFRELLFEYGITSFATSTPLYEEILPRTPAPQRAVLFGFIKQFLERLQPVDRLTIFDPYFFSSADPTTYASIVSDILDPTVRNLSTVTFVRDRTKDKPGVLPGVYSALRTMNATLNLAEFHTSDVHDRFWIVDGQRGLFIGTSLNGIGNRLCLLDKMNEADVAEFKAQMARLGISI